MSALKAILIAFQPATEQVLQGIRIYWLVQDEVAFVLCLAQGRFVHFAADHGAARSGAAFQQGPQHGETALALTEVLIAKDHIRHKPGGQLSTCLLQAGGGAHIQSPAVQQCRPGLQDLGLIVDHEALPEQAW